MGDWSGRTKNDGLVVSSRCSLEGSRGRALTWCLCVVSEGVSDLKFVGA